MLMGGMTVNADIVIDRKPLINLLIAPLKGCASGLSIDPISSIIALWPTFLTAPRGYSPSHTNRRIAHEHYANSQCHPTDHLRGKTLLIDPMLAPKGTYPGFPGTARADIRNPMVELPVDVQTLLDADAVIVTHTHADHWDQYAVELIAKGKPIYVQNDSDAALLRRDLPT